MLGSLPADMRMRIILLICEYSFMSTRGTTEFAIQLKTTSKFEFEEHRLKLPFSRSVLTSIDPNMRSKYRKWARTFRVNLVSYRFLHVKTGNRNFVLKKFVWCILYVNVCVLNVASFSNFRGKKTLSLHLQFLGLRLTFWIFEAEIIILSFFVNYKLN